MKTSPAVRAATRLSGSSPRLGISSRFFGLARPSLLLVSLSMLSGCLVEDPPLYTEPTQTPPRINFRLAEPAPGRIILVEKGDPITFRIPVTSEDVGEPLTAVMFLDESTTPIPNFVEIPGSTLDDLDRRIEIVYPGLAEVDFGCHRIKISVSHTDNLKLLGEPINQADVADAYWLMNVIDLAAGDDSSILRNCPTGTSPSPSGSTTR
jgi:hypothetical protein